MAVALYPTTVDPLIGYSVEPVYFTQRTPTKSGADVTEKLWDTPRFKIRLSYRVSVSDAATILNFHHARRGAYEAFDFIDLHSREWNDVYVGLGDGATKDYDCDVETSGGVVYIDGVSQVGGVDYTFSDGTGTNGRDEIKFTVAPSADEVITIDGSGNRFYTVRFDHDNALYKTTPQFSGTTELLDLRVNLISQR